MRLIHGFLFGLLVLAPNCWQAHAQGANTAQEILAEATHRAAEQHKIVFFEFGASWCLQCHRLDGFLSSPAIAPIVQKYFVVVDVHYQEKVGKHPELETPGAETDGTVRRPSRCAVLCLL
jgi:thiol-disulfide isomerase/thioredoxin